VGQQLGGGRDRGGPADPCSPGLPAGPVQALETQAQAHPQAPGRPRAPVKAPAGQGDDRPARRSLPGPAGSRGRRRRLRFGAWRGLPARVTITFRLRKDGSLHEPPPPPPPAGERKRGRPPKKGDKLASLAQIATDAATAWRQVTANSYGKPSQLAVHLRPCLWYRALGDTPVRLLLVQDADKPSGYQLALITTDLSATAEELVERYADRWAIEVCFEEAKHQAGVGDAQNRTQRAVERTVPFQFLCMTLTIIWYALHGHHPADVKEHRARAPWYLSKTNPSFADMLAKLRRTIIADQYSPGRLRDPYRQKINAIQQAWAALLP
jgi:hypothetical protein